MTVRSFIIGSLFSSIIAWAVWVLIIIFLNPLQAGLLGFILFYLALLLAAGSTFALGGYLMRRLIAPELLPSYAVRTSLRQGVLVGLFLDLMLLLEQMRIYRWWIAVGVTVVALLTEIVFLNYDRYNKRRHRQAESGSAR